MHPPLKLHEPYDLEALHRRHKQAASGVEATRWLALWMVGSGLSGQETARRLGRAPRTIQRWVHAFNAAGEAGLLRDGRAGRPSRRSYLSRLSPEQAQELDALLERGEAPPAVGGGLWSGPKVARWLEQALGREPGSIHGRIHDSTGWATLKRLGYSLQRPRPSNPKSRPEDREAFKGGASPSS